MKKIILFIIVTIFFSGCSYKSHYIEVGPNTKLSAPKFAFTIPNSYPNYPFETNEIYNSDNTVFILRDIPNMMKEDIRIFSYDLNKTDKHDNLAYDLLSKKNIFEYYINTPLSEFKLEGHRESRTEYYKRYIDYIAGLKCYTISLSTNIGMGLGNRLNSITCPYYNKDGEEMAIMVHYDFIFTTGGTVLEGSKQSSTKNYTPQQMNYAFKQDVKEIFDSLDIYDIDKDRMIKQGMYYPDKKYDINADNKVKNFYTNIDLNPNEKATSPYFTFNIPNSYPEYKFKSYFNGINTKYNEIYFFREIPNILNDGRMKESARVYTFSIYDPKFDTLSTLYNKIPKELIHDLLTNPKSSYKHYLGMSFNEDELKYRASGMRYINYVAGLKCYTSLIYRKELDYHSFAHYDTTCPYYNKNGEEDAIVIQHKFKFTKENSTNEEFENLHLNYMKGIKQMIDSIVIKNIDINKMKRLNIYYPNKKYDINAEDKIRSYYIK
ncbi:hypothetical protein BFG05_08040 [Campylobacter pinnipediorum subsp. pinnipediorum]|uniref:hypothetical protein n=2 Tax=Campylobacter pinnipediorum TaxID=1965231 RepID=UPI000994F0D2|nr:hypothetical protein [Campylobacter pinnipediorum]OPA75978.1 hypothetical protein BFG05_05420 [Campylobacter pinnipediorum subsp. pinnipediorum]OPA80678.1 hypothetical protein BFG05_08040 [Campylobacter pinnipediorum subsp. pinnipediorum]